MVFFKGTIVRQFMVIDTHGLYVLVLSYKFVIYYYFSYYRVRMPLSYAYAHAITRYNNNIYNSLYEFYDNILRYCFCFKNFVKILNSKAHKNLLWIYS